MNEVVRLQPVEDESGDLFLPIPDHMLEALGLKIGDLVELSPQVRVCENSETGTSHEVERLITIRRPRM
jgi:hypothetical protein